MARMISADYNKIKGLRDELNHILSEGQISLVRNESTSIAEDSDLTQREEVILEYIKKNPGKIKEQVVNYFTTKGKYSRIPILDSIENLAKLSMIVIKKEHRQKHSLYLNDQSLLISELQSLEEFKEVFLHLLREAKRKYDLLDKKKQNTTSEDNPSLWSETESLKIHIIILVHDMFQYMVDTYGLVALFRWPAMTSDNVLISRLYASVFAKLREILLSSFEFIPSIKDPKEILEEILTKRYDDLYRFKPLVTDSHKHGLGKEFDPVMQCIWNIRSNISASLPSPRGHPMPIIEDYKEALAKREANSQEAEAQLQ
jgi:hypothetical protein